jgi:hypothetical protein
MILLCTKKPVPDKKLHKNKKILRIIVMAVAFSVKYNGR